jgi:Zn-dependent protease
MFWFLNQPISEIIAFAITAILAFAYHEFAHAIVADRLGDPTPRDHGRITLNPFPHLSVFGLIMLFLVGFGWAVTPVNPNLLRGNYRRSMAIVAIAGPLANLAMAILWALPLRLGFVEPSSAEIIPTPFQIIWSGVTINLLLFSFNLIPIPPLDGFTILQGIVPPDLAYQLDAVRQYGSFLLLGALFLLPAIGINIIGTVVGQVSNLLLPPLTGLF